MSSQKGSEGETIAGVPLTGLESFCSAVADGDIGGCELIKIINNC
jgi:hypothetical protein